MTPDDMMARRDAELTYAEHRSTFGFAKTAGKLLSDEGERELAEGGRCSADHVGSRLIPQAVSRMSAFLNRIMPRSFA